MKKKIGKHKKRRKKSHIGVVEVLVVDFTEVEGLDDTKEA